MPFALDTQYFVIAIIAMFVIGLPLITKRVVLPAQMRFEEVPPERRSPGQTEFFQDADTKLSPSGFHSFATFRVANLQGTNLSRAYGSTSDPARILVTLMTGPGGTIAHNYTEIISKYQDGTILSTKNSNVSAVFDEMPGRIIQSFPAVKELEELKRRHDAKAATLVARQPIYRDDKKFFDEFQDYHRRFCEFQQSRKLLRYDPSADIYRATLWTGLRGIRNFLNPLADNFTLPRLAVVIVFAAALPLVVVWQRAPIVDWLRARTGLDFAVAYAVALGVAVTLGGAVVGYLFRQKSFIWAFLLGYIPTRLLGGAGRDEIFFCIWMAVAAEYVSRWRSQREKLV